MNKLKSYITTYNVIIALCVLCCLEGVGVLWINHAWSRDKIEQKVRDKKIIAITGIGDPFGMDYLYVGLSDIEKECEANAAKKISEIHKKTEDKNQKIDDKVKSDEELAKVEIVKLTDQYIKYTEFYVQKKSRRMIT